MICCELKKKTKLKKTFCTQHSIFGLSIYLKSLRNQNSDFLPDFFSLLPMADVLAKFELFKCFSQWFQFVWLLKKMCSGVCDSTCSSIFSIPQKHEYPLSSVNYSAFTWLCMFAAHVFSNWWRHLLYLLLEFGLFVCFFLSCCALSSLGHHTEAKIFPF